jgi:hypothetical protein
MNTRFKWKAFNEQNGFTAAQTLLNIVETSMYVYYLYILFAFGRQSAAQGRGAPKRSSVGFLGEQRYVDGQKGGLAVLLGFSAAVMTFSKTLLYCKYLVFFFEQPDGHACTSPFSDILLLGANEFYSGFDNIGHNSARDLIFLWVIPK